MSGNDTEESEEEINQSLRDMGLLEAGMTSDDKRSLWSVIKLSKDTAQAEEQDRQKRAKRNLQFDEVSSRTEISSEVQASCDAQNEEISITSPQTSDTEDEIIEERKKPVVAAVTPLRRDVSSSQRTTATVLPICLSNISEKSADENEDAMVTDSSAQHIETEQSQIVLERLPQPAARRALRLRPNVEHQSPKRDEITVTMEVSSNVLDRLILTSVSTKESEEDMNSDSISAIPSRDNCEPSSSSSSTTASPMKHVDQDDCPSTVINVDEISPVRILRQDTTTGISSLFKQNARNNEKAELDKFSSDNDNFSALDEEIKNVNKEKSINGGGETNDNVPSPSSDSLLNETSNAQGSQQSKETKQIEDKERNIDAFNCDRSNYEWTLKVRKVKRACSRLPFYIPPHKMDIHTYIAYFKRCINEHAAQLIEVQKRNYKCVPWGDPVVVGESLEQGDQKNSNLGSLQRYNFRNRKVARYKEDTVYEAPNTQNNDDGDDEAMFVDEKKSETSDDLFDSLLKGRKEKKTSTQKELGSPTSTSTSVVAKQGPVKRKSESNDDKIIELADKSSEPEEKRAMPSSWLSTVKRMGTSTRLKRKNLGPVYFNAGSASSWKDLDMDLDGEFEPSRKNLRSRDHAGKICAKKKTRHQKPSEQSKTSKKNDLDDETDIFAEMDAAEGVAENVKKQQETDLIRPAPLKLRKQGRRRIQQNEEEKQTEPTPMDDISVVYDAADDSNKEDTEDHVPCPICSKKFPAKSIEAHASECNEYCQEEIPEEDEEEEELLHITPVSSPEESVEQNPSGVSQDCWTQFENGQELENKKQQQPQQQNSLTLRSHTRQDELEAPLSPIHCFVPISAQHDSEIDYHNQFRVATRLNLKKKTVRKRKKGRKRKRRPNKKRPPAKKKKATVSTCVKEKIRMKKLEDMW